MKNFFALLVVFSSSVAIAQEEPKLNLPLPSESDEPLRLTSKKKYFVGINFLSGYSTENLQTGAYVQNVIDTSDIRQVNVGTGGGAGVEIVVGREIQSFWRVSLFSGFQLATGKPRASDQTVKFQRMYGGALIGILTPVSKRISVGLEMGGICQYSSKLIMKFPDKNKATIQYQPGIGSVVKVSGAYSLTSDLQIDLGFRYQWMALEFKEIKFNDSNATLTSKGESQFNIVNSNGGTIYLGASYRF